MPSYCRLSLLAALCLVLLTELSNQCLGQHHVPDEPPGYLAPDAIEYPGPHGWEEAPPLAGPALGLAHVPRQVGWRVEVAALPVFRDMQRDVAFASVGPNGPVALSTSDLDYEFQSGVRGLLGRQINERYSVEFVYFEVDDWTDLEAIYNDDINSQDEPGNLTSVLSNFGDPETIGLDFNDMASLDIRYTYQTAELNLRRKVDMPKGPVTVDILYGGRYARIRESLGFTTVSDLPAPGGATNSVQVATRNTLRGFQLGGVMHYHCRPGLWVDFEVKGAILQNEAQQQTVYTNTSQGVTTTFVGGREEDRTSILGDLALLVNIDLAPYVWVQLGYQATWLTGVALAANNFESDLDVLRMGPADIDHAGQVVYHGPRIGLGGSW